MTDDVVELGAAEEAIRVALEKFSVEHPTVSTSTMLYAVLYQAVKMTYFNVGFDKDKAANMLKELSDLLLENVDKQLMAQFGTSQNVNDYVDAIFKGTSTKN